MKSKRTKTWAEKAQPRPPDILRKGGVMRDRKKYIRKPKHTGRGR